MKNIFYLTISLFYIGCTTPDTSESQLFIQAEEMAIESIAKGLEPYVEKVEYIPLETKPDALIQSPISGIIFYKDRIICTDRSLQQILLYDLKGNFVNKISSIGKGKGEFIQISAFTVNTIEDQLILYDGFTKKILRYKSNGDFIDESQLSLKQQPIGIYCAKMVHQPSTGFYYLYTAQQQTPETTKALGGNFDLIITDKYFNIISTQFPRNRIEHSLLVRRDHLQTDGEHVYFSNPLSNKIFKYAGRLRQNLTSKLAVI